MPTNSDEMKVAFQAAIEAATAKDRKGWHFDLNVNVALVITLLATWGTSAWYLSKQDSRTTSLELTATQSAARVDKIAESAVDVKERLTRVEDRVDSSLNILRRLDAKAIGIDPPSTRQ